MTKNNIKRSRLGSAIAATTACLLAGSTLIASPATAFNSVTIENGDAWNVHDAANPGVDTGSVTDNRSKALMGYGGIRVDVSGGTSPINGILLRGFGLDFDGVNAFESTRAVDIDGVLVQRQITVSDQEGYGRFFDSFTNSGSEAVTVEVAFGGQLGYNTGKNQSNIAATSSGDLVIDSSDSWSSWYTPSAGACDLRR